MTTLQQIAEVERMMYFYQGSNDVTALENIKHTLLIVSRVEALGLDMDTVFERISKEEEEHKKRNTLYQMFVVEYDAFCKNHIGVGAKMDGSQGKALKSIIKFLKKESKSKDDDGALLAWKFIFQNWKSLSHFISKQTSLTSINKNLLEIITELRNGRNAKQAGKATTANIRSSIKRRG